MLLVPISFHCLSVSFSVSRTLCLSVGGGALSLFSSRRRSSRSSLAIRYSSTGRTFGVGSTCCCLTEGAEARSVLLFDFAVLHRHDPRLLALFLSHDLCVDYILSVHRPSSIAWSSLCTSPRLLLLLLLLPPPPTPLSVSLTSTVSRRTPLLVHLVMCVFSHRCSGRGWCWFLCLFLALVWWVVCFCWSLVVNYDPLLRVSARQRRVQLVRKEYNQKSCKRLHGALRTEPAASVVSCCSLPALSCLDIDPRPSVLLFNNCLPIPPILSLLSVLTRVCRRG